MVQKDYSKGIAGPYVVAALAVLLSLIALAFSFKVTPSTSGRGGTSNADVISLDGSLLAGQLTTGSSITLGSQGSMWDYIAGGSNAWQGNITFTASSSVIMSVANPSSATTSIEYAKCRITGGNLGATQTMDLSTSTTAVGSSTVALVSAYSLAAGAIDTIIWQPGGSTASGGRILNASVADGHSPYVLAPGQRLNLRIATATPSQAYPAASLLTGSCSIVLQD